MEVFVTHRVLDEIRLVFFNQLAAAQRIRIVELLVQVEAPVAIRGNSLTNLLARGCDLAHSLTCVEDVIYDRRSARRTDRRVDAEAPVAGLHHLCRALLQAHAGSTGETAGGITLAVVPNRAAQDLMHRQAQRFPL